MIPMILFLFGKDTFRSRQQLSRMTKKFSSDRDPQGLNLVTIDCVKATPEKIWGEIFAAPFLAEKRMVVLERIFECKNDEFFDQMLTYITEQTLPESTVLVVWDDADQVKKKQAKALFSRLAEEKYAQRFDVLSESKLEGWIAAECEVRGYRVVPAALKYLVKNVGSDMWRLDSLLDQLGSYVGESAITEAAVRLFVEEKVDDSIFSLVDAIVARYPKRVFSMLQEQYNQGKDVMYVYAMVTRQFRILLQLRDIFEREESFQSDLVAKKLGVHPFVVKKSLPVVKRYTMQELKEVYDALLQLDIQIKTGQGDQRMLMDVFVGRVCVS